MKYIENFGHREKKVWNEIYTEIQLVERCLIYKFYKGKV